MIKYYKKKGTDKATHQAEFKGDDVVIFKTIENGTLRAWSSRNEFYSWLKETDFKKVLEGKLHLGEKVDRALEELRKKLAVKDCYANNPKRAEDIEVCVETLLDYLEEPKPTTNTTQLDINTPQLNTPVEEVKLPEVGKRYRDKYGEFVVRDGERGYYNVDYNEGTVIHATNRYKMEDFWTFCEELPENNIEPTKEVLQIKSIWKDVSELPKDLIEDCFIEYRRGGFSIATAYNGQFIVVNQSYGRESIKKYCTLTDYINNTEERLKKLEGK